MTAQDLSKLSIMIGGLKPTGLGDYLQITTPAGMYSLNNGLGKVTFPWIYRRQDDTWGRVPDALGVERYFEKENPEASAEWELLGKLQFIPGKGNLNLVAIWKMIGATYNAPYNEWDLGDLVTLQTRSGRFFQITRPQFKVLQQQDAVLKAQWMNRWNVRALQIANENGLKLSLLSSATGGPSFHLLPYLYESLAMMKAGEHLADLHEYGVEGALRTSPSSGALRCVTFHDLLPPECQTDIVISEFWWGNGVEEKNQPAQLSDAQWYGTEIHKYSFIKWASFFQLNESGENNMPVEMLLQYAQIAKEVAQAAEPPEPPEPPVNVDISINGDFASGISQVNDLNGTVWELDTSVRQEAGYPILKDGSPFAQGLGVALLYFEDQVYVTNQFGQWFRIIETGYEEIPGDPRVEGSGTPLPVSFLLNIPWVSQLGPEADYAPGDCGAASLCAWLKSRGQKVIVNDVSKATGKAPGYTYTTFADLDRAANMYGLDLVYKFGTVTPDMIRTEIDAGRPMILLVDYPALPKRYDPNYVASHWILVVGYRTDHNFFYHDPYWPDARGQNLLISEIQLMKAMQDVVTDGNTAMQGIAQNMVIVPPTPIGQVAIQSVHGRADGGDLRPVDLQAAQQARLNGYKCFKNPPSTYTQLVQGGILAANILVRLDHITDRRVTATQYVNGNTGFYDLPLKEALLANVRWVELFNEPDQPVEGLGKAWADVNDFCALFKALVIQIRQFYPVIRILSPAISQNPEAWWSAFNTQGVFAISDGIAEHCYWTQNDPAAAFPMNSEQGGRRYRRLFQYLSSSKKVHLTEVSNNATIVDDATKGREYAEYLKTMELDQVARVDFFCISASDLTFNQRRETWVRNASISAIPGEVAKR